MSTRRVGGWPNAKRVVFWPPEWSPERLRVEKHDAVRREEVAENGAENVEPYKSDGDGPGGTT